MRTIEDIEADITAIKASNLDWATNISIVTLLTELIIEKNQTQPLSFNPVLIKESVEVEDIPVELGLLDADEDQSNHASTMFEDADIARWFVDNVAHPRPWELDHPDDVPPEASRNITSYADKLLEKGLKLWDVNNDPYSSVMLELVSKRNPARAVNISGRADYLLTKREVGKAKKLSHALCAIKKQSDGKREEQCEHELEANLFLLMNKLGLVKLTGLLILDDGRRRAYKAIRGEDGGCLYFSNDTFHIFYIADVMARVLTDLEML